MRFYPPPQEKGSSLMTKYRVIEHTDQVLAKDYKSTANVTLSNPQTHPQFATLKDKPLGPRGLRLEERIKAQVDSEFSQKQYEVFQGTRHVAYETTTSEAHDIPGFKPYL